jgi:sterol desaturase/sphingolipid hydroxylase (fatty acid hydroxylase superfamily)
MKILSSPIFLIVALFLVLVVSIALIFSQTFDYTFTLVSDKMISITHHMWEQFISMDKLKYILILSACFVIDIICIGYNKSAMANILKPNKSTKSDIYIFIIGLMGLRYYFVIFSFLLVGYFSSNFVESNLAFSWLHSIDSAFLQLIVYMIAYDFLDYWVHRFAHRVSWWWEIHRFHHLATNFNIITVARSHPLDLAFADFITIIPMAMLGVPIEQLLIISIIRSMLGKLQHSMIDWDFGIIGKYILMSPVAHRIHHSPYLEHWDKHYGHTFIFWDRTFGTYYNGNFINDKVGLSNTTDNEHGLVYDIVMGKINFLNAFFLKKWSFKEGMMSSSEIKAYEHNRPKQYIPIKSNEMFFK